MKKSNKNLKILLFGLNVICLIAYLAWRIFYTIPTEYGLISLIAGILLVTVEIAGMFESFVHYFNMYNVENPKLPEIPPDLFPDVDIFIATYNEPTDLLFKTVNGCVHMDYPDSSKVHIYLCDDGNRYEVSQLAEHFHIGYLGRTEHKGAKAGNLNHAMSKTSSPLIVTFDADMIPNHNFLMGTVPYFVGQEIKNKDLPEKKQIHLGFVQSPQSFYNPDLFQFNLFSEKRIPNEQDYFYKDVQVAHNKSNSVIYGGSNTLLSRKALEDIGGFYTESVTEDFATGILLQKKGYTCYAINTVLASGLSPTDLKSLINQRIRWGRGVIQTARKMHIAFSPKLSFAQKANYLASVWYWYNSWKRLIYILSPILFATFGVIVVRCTLPQVLMFWLPMYITSNLCLKMLSRDIRTTKWTNLYETTIFPFMLIPILMESLCISMTKFKVTSKDSKDNEPRKLRYLIPHSLLVLLSFVGIFNCFQTIWVTKRLDSIVILFWLITNLYNLIMSLFFVFGRKIMRKSERQNAEIDCSIKTLYTESDGVTNDISEGGISVFFPHPVDIEENEDVTITLHTDRYHAIVLGKVVNVMESDHKWKYVFIIKDLLDSKCDYLQLIYDRTPSLPTSLEASKNILEDLHINLRNRIYVREFHNRSYPRINIMKEYPTDLGITVKVLNFNYKYVLLQSKDFLPPYITLHINNDLYFELSLSRTIDEHMILYDIENINDIHCGQMRIAVKNWLAEI